MANNEPRWYKIRIIDPSWEMLGKPIYVLADQKWHDLDNKRRHHFGPEQDIYFHYYIQVLRHIWQQSVDDSIVMLKSEKVMPN
jgi:hypothetical protein